MKGGKKDEKKKRKKKKREGKIISPSKLELCVCGCGGLWGIVNIWSLQITV